MASRFWTFVTNLAAGQFARAEAVSAKFQEVEAALDLVALELNRVVRYTGGADPGVDDFKVPDTEAGRANKVTNFNAAGLPQMAGLTWTMRGTWAAGTAYAVNDVVRVGTAPVTGLWIATIAHTASAAFATDSGTKWVQLLDLTTINQALRLQKIIGHADSPYAATAGDDLLVDVSAGAVTITLPAAPALLDQAISVTHIDGVIATNNITIARNGKNIMGSAADMTVTDTNAAFELAYSDAARGWRLVRGT